MLESLDALSYEVIGACIEVHRAVGPGMLESAYEECVSEELKFRGIPHERQVPLALTYRTLQLPTAYRIDLVVDSQIVLELKRVERLLPLHEAQTLTYLRIGKFPMGLLVNFHSAILRGQIRRFVRSSALTVPNAP
ncbi:MAG: hypothetical protein JWP87_3900 [Labilithrix sp.]|nr:hypothetical protein [Labilithrix sp.]